uniref:formin-like protein 5 n=1 Tax=Lonchura striata TaxID=40157 RepID=UPI001293AF30|nr:formin-like protein 5 [Lonchura striata domestica]
MALRLAALGGCGHVRRAGPAPSPARAPVPPERSPPPPRRARRAGRPLPAAAAQRPAGRAPVRGGRGVTPAAAAGAPGVRRHPGTAHALPLASEPPPGPQPPGKGVRGTGASARCGREAPSLASPAFVSQTGVDPPARSGNERLRLQCTGLNIFLWILKKNFPKYFIHPFRAGWCRHQLTPRISGGPQRFLTLPAARSHLWAQVGIWGTLLVINIIIHNNQSCVYREHLSFGFACQECAKMSLYLIPASLNP